MQVDKTKESVYDDCVAEGFITPLQRVDVDKTESNITISDEDFASAEDNVKNKRWNSAYKGYYDALHGLAEAFLRVKKIKSKNHQCLFVYICIKYPELELDWSFFEKIRMKRNGINYYGKPVSNEDIKDIKLRAQIYIKTLKDAITRSIK